MIFLNEQIAADLVSVNHITWAAAEHNVAPRNVHALAYRVKGKGDFTVGANSFSAEKGDVLFMPAGKGYSVKYNDGEIYAVHFHATIKNPEIFNFCPQNTVILQSYFEKALKVWNEQKTGYKYRALSVFYQILSELVLQYTAQSELKAWDCFLNAANDLKENFISGVSIEQICENNMISVSYFRKKFTQIYGIAPVKYLTEKRMLRAQSLLLQSDLNVGQVALQCGFDDCKYFSRTFKKFFGCPPKETAKLRR